ncbi:unnamed protein product [Auanema sp. JU1783]|nr:unnamed protein product [Auanema sp. JU1783]
MASKKACVLLAEGAEDMETVIIIDVLRRGGVDVDIVGIDSQADRIVCARDIILTPEKYLNEVKDSFYEVVVLPGGAVGADNLAKDESVGAFLRAHHESGKYVAAICAAPKAFAAHKIPAASVTSYPAFRKLMEDAGYNYSEELVVVAGNVITSRGPGTAFQFSLKLVELLIGLEKAKTIAEQMLLTY